VTEGATTASIVARGITVGFDGHLALDGVDVVVEQGTWLTIVGPNGSGKSTLLKVLAGLLDPGGTVELAGRPVSRLRRRDVARLVALVPQSPVVPPGLRVSEYVLLGRTPHLAPLAAEGRDDREAAARALDQLGLVELAGRELATLSGGERQRVIIARALAQGAPILLLDEPTTALDVGHQQEVLELVDRLRVTNGLTVVSTMHDLTLAGQYAHHLALLDAGRIVASGSSSQVLTEENVARYYRARVKVVRDGPFVIVVPVR
jgi:iron complex transport system ATP-binding protein